MSDADKSISPSAAESPAPVTLDWLADGHIACFTIINVARSSIDQWFTMLTDVMIKWPAGRKYLVLIDVSSKDISFTPYIRERAKQLDTVNPALKGRVALIFTQSFVAQMAKIFMRTARRSNVVTEVFFNRDEGVEWLKQMVEQ